MKPDPAPVLDALKQLGLDGARHSLLTEAGADAIVDTLGDLAAVLGLPEPGERGTFRVNLLRSPSLACVTMGMYASVRGWVELRHEQRAAAAQVIHETARKQGLKQELP